MNSTYNIGRYIAELHGALSRARWWSLLLLPAWFALPFLVQSLLYPLDVVKIDHGKVVLNGKRLNEPYVPPRFEDDRSEPEMRIPSGQYYVMGDHRCISLDSRVFGPVERGLIYGKAAFVFWPMDQAGVVR